MESVREVSQTDRCFGSGTAARRTAARRQGSAMVPTAYGRGSHREHDRGSRAADPLRKQLGTLPHPQERLARSSLATNGTMQ